MDPEKIISMVKIVTVEDSLLVAKRIESMLTDVDNLEFLGNAVGIPQALELIACKQPDAVVLDLHLGNGDSGIDLLTILRNKYPRLKIIILTNLADPHYQSACFDLGADYFFDKSNDFDKVPDVLKDIQL